MDCYNDVFSKYIPNGECSIGTNDKHDQYSLECYDNSANYGRAMLSREELKEMADAIYAELGLGWLPYPENKPPLAGYYFVSMVNVDGEPSTFYAKYSFSKNTWLSPFGGLMEDEFYKAIAFMEIPTPYQPA